MVRTYILVCITWFAFFKSKAQEAITLIWEIQHPITNEWIPLGERGSVQEALFKEKILPDPYFGENEKLYQWIEDHQWHFRSRFFLSEDLFNAEEVTINFPCIDTYASIYINNQKILEAQNYFHPYHVEVQNNLVLGYNHIEAVFTPPVMYHKSIYEQQSFHYPAPNDISRIKVAPLSRKPQYQFGWDWAPRINTIGFPNPVSVKVNKNKIVETVVVNTIEIGQTAHMQLVVVKEQLPPNSIIRSVNFDFSALSDSCSIQKISFHISNPILWWPSGIGTSYIYTDTLIVTDENGFELQRFPYSFGVRTVNLIQENDQWGTSFVFLVNGKPIFMKGGNMIPPTLFGGYTTKQEWQDWVRMMVNSNFNMVRIWGGGDYATEDFLNECDRLGLMVWHDAMFACAIYPGDSLFLLNVKDEFDFQLPRLTKHPSVVYINGNNEVDVAWKNWGFQLQYMLNKGDQAVIENGYESLFKNLLPNTLSTFSNLPYVHTSPLSNWGKPDYYNHGTQHYWGVWHGTDPMSDFATKIGRFNAEFGFQSFPEFSTLLGFSNTKDWDLKSDIMKHHQKSYVGNGMILKNAKMLYGKPKSFEEFVYFSQLTQDHAITSAISGHLLDAPRCMGSLYWQINDCWPAPTWSSIDYYGHQKALHYHLKELFDNVTVVKQSQQDVERIYLLANNQNADTFSITTTVFSIESRGVKKLSVNMQSISLNNFNHHLLFEKKVKSIPQAVEIVFSTGTRRLFLTGGLAPGRKARYQMSLSSVDTIARKAILVLENEDFMGDVWLYSNVPGVHFNMNFCHFLPGKHEIPFTFVSSMGIIKLMYR